MSIHTLDGSWHFRIHGALRGGAPRRLGLDQWMPARMPGTIHYHLQKLGRIADPYLDRNELAVQWIDEQDWELQRTVKASTADCACARQQLVFDGLDTVATVFLNGRKVGHSVNMFRQVVVDVGGVLRPGENLVRVLLASPTRFALAEAERGKRRVDTSKEFRWQTGEVRETNRAWIRKVQCHFGWDWGVYLATSGVWQPARLECSDAPRLASLTTDQVHRGPVGAPTRVALAITARFEAAAPCRGTLVVRVAGKEQRVAARLKRGENAVRATLAIDEPKLWWPAGEGDRHLYELEAHWEDASGAAAPGLTRRIGLRTVELITERDRDAAGRPGLSFRFRVNGRDIYAKGANWIPADQYVDRCTPEVYRHLLGSMVEANMNMVRVWGGGWYEQEVFYDLCDELGLMVWQDFMMACALYPGTPGFIKELTAEARYQVRRLHDRPSIVLWCGDNENLEGSHHWWRGPEQPRYRKLYKNLLTRLQQVVETEDASRRFWISSPSSGDYDHNPHDPNFGDVHYWTVWHGRQPFSNYHMVKPRFSSEFGFQSFPEPRTVRACVPKDQMNPSSRVMEHHQRSTDGNMLITNTMAREMPIPKDFDAFCWVSQVNQAMAIRTAVEHWRRLKPWCMGTVYWQINDLWPVASWSSIDWHGRWKVLQHEAARFYAPLLASLVHEGGKLTAWATSDLPRPLALRGTLELMTWAGKRIARVPLRARLAAGESRAIASHDVARLLAGKAEPHQVIAFITLDGDGAHGENFATLVPWKWATLAKPRISTRLVAKRRGLALEVVSDVVAPFFHAEVAGTESHFAGDFAVLRPGRRYVLPLVAHADRGQAPISLAQAKRGLSTFSLYDTYAH
jgi:beta-mannosidase